MDIFVHAAQWFFNLFQTGGQIFISWTTVSVDSDGKVTGFGFLPTVLMLLIAMNSLIQLIGQDRMNGLAMKAGGNPFSRYLLLPFVGAFMLANPMALSLGRFLPEKYKPSYYASAAQFCHTSNGVFPHINPAELFIWLGIAQGVTQLGLSTGPLAIRYLLVGLVMNFVAGWVTDLTTAYVSKQQGVTLSKVAHVEGNK